MTQRRESVVDRRIREAQEQGAFDDLPGRGKPLPGRHGPDDEHWWLRKEIVTLPASGRIS